MAIEKDENGLVFAPYDEIVVDMKLPDNEWTETQNKARAVLRAAEMVLAGLDAQAQQPNTLSMALDTIDRRHP